MNVKDVRTAVLFTHDEIWMLHAFVRHDRAATNRDRYPIVSTSLNEQIVLALVACEDSGMKEYNLFLSEADILLIDWCIRDDMKSPTGAKGKEILLKLFRVRSEAAYGPLGRHQGPSYEQAINLKTVDALKEEDHAKSDDDPDQDAYDDPYNYA